MARKKKIFENLLIASIDRSCDLSIIDDISRLWKHSFSISNEHLVQECINILKSIRNDFEPDSGIYMYAILNLGLVEINKNLGLAVWKNISNPKLDEVLKHKTQTETQSKFNQPYLNFLLLSEGTLEEFIDWNEMECGLRKPISTDLNIVANRICRAIKQEEGQEYDEIRNYVHKFMDMLCNKIQDITPLLQCIPNQVGSAREHTRNFHPDEFDYELVFQDFAKLFKVIKFENVFFFRLAGSPDCLPTSIRNCLFDFQGKWYLHPDKFKETLNKAIKHVLSNAKSYFRIPFTDFKVESTLFPLSIEPFGFFHREN